MAEPLSAVLTQQHRDMDAMLESLTEGDSSRVHDMLAALRKHIWIEEEWLFDAITDSNLVMPLYIMQYEHAEMWSFMERIEALDGGGGTRMACRKLRKLLSQHDPKEEDLIYAAVDTRVDDDPSLRAAIETGGVPDGWVCRGQRDDFAPPPGAPPWPPGGRTL